MKTLKLTQKQAHRFILSHQGLSPPYSYDGKEGILDFIRHVGCIQFDPLDIVGRNPELVLHSRINDYRPAMLEELLYTDRKLLDAWDKMMAIYPVEDWPYLHYRQREAALRSQRRGSSHIKEVTPLVRQAIEERGPLSSIDLDYDRKVDWSWGPTRLAKVTLETCITWENWLFTTRYALVRYTTSLPGISLQKFFPPPIRIPTRRTIMTGMSCGESGESGCCGIGPAQPCLVFTGRGIMSDQRLLSD